MILGTFMCPAPQKAAIQGFPGDVQDVETRKRSAPLQESSASTQASGEKEHWSISDARSALTLGQSNLRTMTIDLRLFAFPYELQEGIRLEHRKATKLKIGPPTIEETA